MRTPFNERSSRLTEWSPDRVPMGGGRLSSKELPWIWNEKSGLLRVADQEHGLGHSQATAFTRSETTSTCDQVNSWRLTRWVTVGDLRWRAPRMPDAWQVIRKADQFSASCIQNIVPERKPWTFEFMTHGEISEDCLYLNIWTPAKSAGEKRQVFFWLYGGGNVEDRAAVPVYDGENLAKKGLVVVTINYRLGLFGFFTHPEPTKESDISDNYGLLDQLAALQWVHDNIAAFGGDPARVTIAGQSAGASDAHILVASPFCEGSRRSGHRGEWIEYRRQFAHAGRAGERQRPLSPRRRGAFSGGSERFRGRIS
jgi:hypothetical protein